MPLRRGVASIAGMNRIPLPTDISRCVGLASAQKCADCARREQLKHDKETRCYPQMHLVPKVDGSCVYWIKQEYQ